MQLGRIEIFPVKSLDGVTVQEARITAGGILENDRVYAMMDSEGRYVNGKRTARVHDLRSAFDEGFKEVRLWQHGQAASAQFPLSEPSRIDPWLSDFFGFPVALQHDPVAGFPDDREAFGPTVVSESSVRVVCNWYPGLTFENVRRRFRANLELTGSESFDEDRLYGAPGERKPFHIGSVCFLGHNPCQRCVVPTRDPETGQAVPDFQKTFMRLRQEHLPAWANRERFNHFYRFAVNTSIPKSETGKILRLGESVAN